MYNNVDIISETFAFALLHARSTPATIMRSQGRIKGGAKGAAAPGPAISRGPHFWEVQKIIL